MSAIDQRQGKRVAYRGTGSGTARIGLALAGGGPLGAIYEVGALAALADALPDLDLTAVDVYVGVSAGGFIAAGLANGFTPHQMCRLFIEGEGGADRFDPAILLRPALREYWRRARSVPALAVSGSWEYLRGGSSLIGAFERFGRAIPTGLFDGDAVESYLRGIFTRAGRTNDFRQLRARLFLVATDLDTGASVTFGEPGLDQVPISRAVQASAALPGMFPPVDINGRYFVDGALRKTLHASVALDEGVDLLFCVNPLVPYDAGAAGARTASGRHSRQAMAALVHGGLPVVLAQTFRALIRSRLDLGMERYQRQYPATDLLLFEPHSADADLFFTNQFSYGERRRLCEHAYQSTRLDLLQRRHQLTPVLARHGLRLDLDVLRDNARHLLHRGRPRRVTPATAGHLRTTLDDLASWLRMQAAPVVAEAGRRR